MPLADVFVGLGQDSFSQLVRGVSMGKLRTYQLFDRVKTRCRLGKLNQENLRKAAPKLWERLAAGDEELAGELSQAVLVSQLEMIVAVLDLLGVPHREGFFDKDSNLAGKLNGDWQQKAFDEFRDRFPRDVLLFYLNHLAREADPDSKVYLPS